METTKTGTFDDLERFLAELEIPEVFANYWAQLQNSVPDIRSEAVVYFLPRGLPSHAHLHGWGARHRIYKREGKEHYGFAESLARLRRVEATGAVVAIQTDSYHGVFLPDVSDKRLLGFLYFASGRREEDKILTVEAPVPT